MVSAHVTAIYILSVMSANMHKVYWQARCNLTVAFSNNNSFPHISHGNSDVSVVRLVFAFFLENIALRDCVGFVLHAGNVL